MDAALSRILRDILALPDITAEESRRLCELCRILDALQGIFMEDTAQVRSIAPEFESSTYGLMIQKSSFVVAYVPSWLKYSYLLELLVSFTALVGGYSMLKNYAGGLYRRYILLIPRGVASRLRDR